MNLNIKTKIILNVTLVIICSILLFTAIVSVMLWEQTERKAHTRILSAANIVAERLENKNKSLKDTSSKIASTSELANLANFIQETKNIKEMEGMLKNERKSLALSLYSIAITTGIPQLTIYGTDQKWICHVEISKNTAKLSIPDDRNREKYLQAETIKGKTPSDAQWKQIRIAPIPTYIQSEYPHMPQSSIIESKNGLWITAQAPLLISTIDISTLNEHKRQVGALHLRTPFGNSFTNDIYKLTNLKVNLYLHNKYVAGNIPAQNEISPQISTGRTVNTFNTLLSERTNFDVANIYDQSYFRGVIPLASSGTVLGHFAIFLSQQETQTDLNHIVKTLLLAALLVILLSVIASLITAKSIVKPIMDLIMIMRQVEEKGDFSIRAKSDGISEIALAGRAFNSLIEELQNETTSRKYAENKLADNSIAIEDQIASRTNELERKTHELARSNKNISSFLLTMSHEIRSPMNGTIGMLKLLTETELSDEQRELIEIADKSNNAMANIVADVLELSQVASGKIAVENIPFDIRVLVEDIIEILEDKAQMKMLDLSYLINAQVPQKVSGDPTKLRQILNHLISNTIKFTERGKILIHVTADSKTINKDENSHFDIRFEIYDSGIKPEQARKQVFNSIDLATGDNKLNPEETGLGISICNQLVNKLGGNFEIKKDMESGSCFVITIPFSNFTLEEEIIEKTAYLVGKKVLLVDSIPANSLVIQQHLMQWEIEFQATSSESEAKNLLLEAYKSKIPFDLILIDVQSPQIQGVKLSSWISSNQNQAKTKQVLITLQGVKGDANIVSNAGISGYLSTPIKAQQLHQCLSMVFGIKPNNYKPLITKHSIKESNRANSIHVLLIDNDLNQLKSLSNALKAYNINSDICTNSEIVSKVISSNKYSMIFAKANMPVLNAKEIAQIINRVEKTKIPIYAIDSNTGKRGEMQSNGLTGVINTPFEHAQIKQIIEKHFDFKKLIQEAELNTQRKQIVLRSNNQAIDITTILSLRSLIPKEELESFITGFFDSCKKQIKKLELAYAANDDNQLIFVTHTLKRSCANMGAIRISGLCHLLEHHFGNNGFDHAIPKMISNIEDEIHNLMKTLPKEIGAFPS
ncbi:MAG: response regulator [Gammaproteobacteria bacterium]|nr:MAG: response regulator [Gammaproteobacteria bacterium]